MTMIAVNASARERVEVWCLQADLLVFRFLYTHFSLISWGRRSLCADVVTFFPVCVRNSHLASWLNMVKTSGGFCRLHWVGLYSELQVEARLNRKIAVGIERWRTRAKGNTRRINQRSLNHANIRKGQREKTVGKNSCHKGMAFRAACIWYIHTPKPKIKGHQKGIKRAHIYS